MRNNGYLFIALSIAGISLQGRCLASEISAHQAPPLKISTIDDLPPPGYKWPSPEATFDPDAYIAENQKEKSKTDWAGIFCAFLFLVGIPAALYILLKFILPKSARYLGNLMREFNKGLDGK